MDKQAQLQRFSLVDSISIMSGLIGIFGFLTGITSIPFIIACQTQSRSSLWFGNNIPAGISISMFVITVMFVYAVYFVVVFKLNRWLCEQGIIKRYFPPNMVESMHPEFDLMFGGRPADYFSLFFFVIIGFVLGLFILTVFFGSNVDLFWYLGLLIFVYLLCYIAKDAASRIKAPKYFFEWSKYD